MNIFLQENATGTGTVIRRLGGRRLAVRVNFQPTPGTYVGASNYRHQPVSCRISFSSFGWGAQVPVGNTHRLATLLEQHARVSGGHMLYRGRRGLHTN